MNLLFFEQISPRVNVISRPVSLTSLSTYHRRESHMHSQPATTFTANRSHNLIDRVLRLRQQLGIDIPLALSDLEATHHFPREPLEPSMEMLRYDPPTSNHREWLIWDQSPCEEKRPEKG
jgi:hypothetical protein